MNVGYGKVVNGKQTVMLYEGVVLIAVSITATTTGHYLTDSYPVLSNALNKVGWIAGGLGILIIIVEFLPVITLKGEHSSLHVLQNLTNKNFSLMG